DDPELGKLPEEAAYVSPVSGVLANHVYNALLTGRPYFLQRIEDADIVARFAREKLKTPSLLVAADGDAALPPAAVAAVVPGVVLEEGGTAAGQKPFSWSAAVEEMRETWPIHYLMPGGAYLRVGR